MSLKPVAEGRASLWILESCGAAPLPDTPVNVTSEEEVDELDQLEESYRIARVVISRRMEDANALRTRLAERLKPTEVMLLYDPRSNVYWKLSKAKPKEKVEGEEEAA